MLDGQGETFLLPTSAVQNFAAAQKQILEYNQRTQRQNNVPPDFPAFVREGYDMTVLGDGYQRSPDGIIFKEFVEGAGELPQEGQVGRCRRHWLVCPALPPGPRHGCLPAPSSRPLPTAAPCLCTPNESATAASLHFAPPHLRCSNSFTLPCLPHLPHLPCSKSFLTTPPTMRRGPPSTRRTARASPRRRSWGSRASSQVGLWAGGGRVG